MSSPEKKRKKKTTTTNKPLLNPSLLLPLTTANLSLPDDLLLSCVARLSRLYYPTLSLVSKTYRSLLASPELYRTRSLLDRTESCLYVCLRFSLNPNPNSNPNPRWFTLCRRPNRTLKRKKKLSENLLIPVTSPHYTRVGSSVVAAGSDIYEIGGFINGVPSSTVSVLDCRFNTWRKAPNMELAREDPCVVAIDGKILVKGGLKEMSSAQWAEVFDPETQTWRSVSCTGEPKEWQSPDGNRTAWTSCLVIDDVVYAYRYGMFNWFDTKVREWRVLQGLEGLPKFLICGNTSCAVKLGDYGGKMAVLWDRHDRSSKCQGRVIWCAVVALERCSSEEIFGTVEWSDAVLKVPKSFAFMHVLSATV